MSVTSARAAGAPSRHRGAVIWIGMFTLLLSLLTPLLTVEAAGAAQGVPPSCDPGFVVSDDGATCVEDPNAQQPGQPTDAPETEVVVESPPATETATEPSALSTAPATQQAAPETYRLTINVYRCDHPEFDPYFSSNAQMVIDQCVQPGSGTFEISSTIPVPQQSGSVVEFQIGPGLAIQELLQPGYDDPIANCFLYDAGGNITDQIGPGEASGGGWKVGGVAGDVRCDWYQVDRGVGAVYVVNMACPSTAGLFPEPSYDELVSLCTVPAGGRQFFVGHGAGLSRMGVSGGEFNDVLFEAIQTGPIEIWLDDPRGFDRARVFCQVTTIDGAPVSPFAEVGAAGFRATGLTLVHGQRIHCSWFNIEQPTLTQGDEPADPSAPTATPGTPSELRVVLHRCPANVDLDDPEFDPLTECQEGPNGVTFTLADDQDDTVDLQSDTGDSVANTVVFGGIPGGAYTVVQADVAPNVGSIFILGCAGGGIDPIPQVIDGTLAVNLPPGVILTCHWFNVLGGGNVAAAEATPAARIAAVEPGTSSITIARYTCPAGFDIASVDANPTAACSPATSGSFDIDDEVDDGAGWIVDIGPGGTGTVGQLPAGRYTIEGSAENGVTATFVWDCYQAGGASSLTDPLRIGNTVQLDLPDDYQVHCDWYDVTGGTGRVVVAKHACGILIPAYTLTPEQLRAQCTEPFAPIDLTVVSDTHQETQPASQDPLQLASFANVPSGYVAVVEQLPDGWAIPIVYCQAYTEGGDPVGPLQHMEVLVGRQVSFQLDPGHVVSCDWYNVVRGFVDVQVTKYACPATIDAYEAGLTDLVVGCTDDPGSVDFLVEDGGLYAQTRAATGGAPASFTDVPSGELRINENMPDGYGLPVVWCRVDHESGGTPVPARQVAVTNGSYAGMLSIYHDASGGQVLACDWFNVRGGAGMVSIWKEACPEGFDAVTATRQQLEQACGDPIPDIDFTLTSGAFSATATSTNLFRYADFNAVPAGPLTVTEARPAGYGTPAVWCRVQEDGKPTTIPTKVEVASDGTIAWDLGPSQWLICEWYNAHDSGNTIHIVKRECPEGTTRDHDPSWYADACTTPHDGVEFRLTDILGARSATTASGEVEFTGVPVGFFAIQELIPESYLDPIVFCGVVSSSGGPIDALPKPVDVAGGYLQGQLEYPSTLYLCYWYNIPGGPGEVVIHKATCPPGYDLHAAGADPRADCGTATNGVPFTLTGIDPTVAAVQGTTGDAGDGTVIFGDLAPGRYRADETAPPGTDHAFVLDCTGGKMGAIRPYPLSTGDSLEIPVGAGESITCDWYNVPAHDDGRLTVVKYLCSTMTWTTNVDCEIHEGSQEFDLLAWNGSGWDYHATQATDGVGQATFTGLAPGDYWLDEQGGEWCHLASERLSGDGDSLAVAQGEETVVRVYNCSADPGDAGKPGKIPTKYPNTGVPPADGELGSPAELPAPGAIGGLAFLLAASRRRAMARSFTRRQAVTGIGLPLAGSLLLGRSLLAQDEGADATPSSALPDRLCLPATPTAGGEADCVRGPVPATLRIDAIGVDAPVEVMETVAGVMQQPTDEVHVAWYKESARLGEIGNIWIAGHLNWWTTPVAVFSNLGLLRAGDEVELLDAEGVARTYAVEWVRQESNLEPPREEVLGMTDHQAVTLITCSGEWNNDISEYDARTVVRAVQAQSGGTPAVG